MSELVLKALIQLFALISDVNDDTRISGRGRDIVKLFLARQLNNELVQKYLALFDDYLRLYHQEHISKGTLKERKRTSLTTTRILSKCERINEELHQKQKIFVLVQLMDFIYFSETLTEQELDFLGLVATAFNIETREYENIMAFVLGPEDMEPESNRLMIIDNNKNRDRQEIKHICNENLKGRLLFLHIVSTNTLIMRYTGGEDLFLNGQNIFPGRTYVFDHGSSIRGSVTDTVYYNDVAGVFTGEAFKLRVSLDAKDISLRFRSSDSGLQKLNFHEESGRLVAIMGGSGVGKSTLMNILSGVTEPDTGEVTVNGYSLYSHEERDNLKGVIGFVPQDDLLFEELTVWQNLYYNARMCLDNLSEEQLREAVEKILDDFDLAEVKELKVGNYLNKVISGGQRKRLNIALELIREPTILFVDEPTSGLSSADAEAVMNMLKAQTYRGRLVIVSIHQPGSDIYKMFDSVVIIDKGGYMIFYGNPTAAVVWFKARANHANALEDQCVSCGNVDTDQLLQIIESKVVNEDGKPTHIRKITPAEWAEAFREEVTIAVREKRPEKEELPENSYAVPGLFKQSGIFFMRDLLTKVADTQYILVSLLGAPLLALLLAYFTKDRSGVDYNFSLNENVPAYMFMSVITAFFLGLIISAEEIVKDRKILKRESFLNLSWFSYVNSKVLMMFIISAIQTFSFIVIGNLILEIRDMTAVYWIVLFSTACLANMIGLNISSSMNSVVAIYILIPFVLIPQLLFSGVLVKFDKLHKNELSNYEYVPVIGDLMPARWSFEALAVEQFRNNRYEKNFFRYDAEISQNTWYASFLIDALRRDLHECRIYRDSVQYNDIVEGNFRKLRFYTDKLSLIGGTGALPAELASSLNREMFSPAVADMVDSYLDSLAKKFHNIRKTNMAFKDSVAQSLVDKMGKEEFMAMKEDYTNRKLREILLDEFTIKKTIETRDKIIQRYEPVYMKPVSRNGRAQFYASNKQAGNLIIDTYWFNISVLWIVTLIFYLALNFDLLRKAVKIGYRLNFIRRKLRKL